MINLSMADPEHNLRPRLTVMGVGGAGGNAINNMIRCNLEGCDFVAANTDSQALAMSLAARKIQLGINLSRGLGAGSKPDIGRAAAEEQLTDIMACLEGSDMLFITAGMGGGTGTGAAPVIARAARECGILTVGVVTKPFHFEGSHRLRQADTGIAELQQYVDTLIVIPNQNLFRIANERTTFAEAFRMADEVLHCGVRGITDLMVMPGFMNLDFADVKTVMGEMGKAMMGTGEADGDNRAIRAAEAAISNPLLDDVSMKGARGVLINITGGMDMTLFEVDQAANRIREEVDPEAQIKVGSTLGEDLQGRIRVSVIATGIDAGVQASRAASSGSVSARPAAESAPKIVTPSQPVAALIQQRAAAQMQAQAQAQVHVPSQGEPKPLVMTPSVQAQTQYFTMPQAVTPQILAQQQVSAPPAAPSPLPEPAAAVEPSETAHASAARAPELAPAAYHSPQAAPTTHVPPPQSPPMSPAAPRSSEPPSFARLAAQQQQQQQQSSYAQRPASPPPPQARPSSLPPHAPATPSPMDMRVAQLATPQQQAAAEQRRLRRTESLFTRITGFGLVRPSAQKEADEHEAALPDEIMGSGESQPRLGVRPEDRPSLSSEQSGTDVLDIPAFLRRQTNH